MTFSALRSPVPVRGIFVVLLLAQTAIAAHGQNNAGVPGPLVDPEEESVQFRMTWDPDSDGYAHRIHYQRSVSDRLMLRGIVHATDGGNREHTFDYFQAEAFVQVSEAGKSWLTGFRFDARVRERGSTGLVGAHWLNEFPLGQRGRARLDLLHFVELGGRARGGLFLQTRADLSWRLNWGRAGLEMFSNYGKWSELPTFELQRHQLGPYATRSLGNRWNLFAGSLFGLTEASADLNLRVWLTKNF